MKLDVPGVGRRARVEMIPLIDCVFILLVFFVYSMLAMTFQRGITVQLPVARNIQVNRDDAVVVTVTARGDLLVNREPVALGALPAAMDAVIPVLEEPRFVINADAEAPHGRVVRVLDELRARGIVQVTVQATPEAGS